MPSHLHREPTAEKRGPLTVVALALAVLCLTAVWWTERLPPAAGRDAPAETFSAARAVEHVARIAERPRPSGSAAHAETREHLVSVLRGLGLETRVQDTAAATSAPELSPTGTGAGYADLGLHNVVARVPGTTSTRPVVLVTHYDSVATSPGANDAGVPVSVLLETARALRSGPAPRNDVLFVFTDAEESGLLGARALVRSPEFLPRDAVVLNFEARGSRGPSLMFETGGDDGWLIEALAEHVPQARTSSLFNAAYRYLPNRTDFTVLKEAGHEGMNIAYLGGYTHYHGSNDTVSHVDPATVQHQGEYALGLARSLGAADLADTPGGNRVYFVAAGLLLSYPVSAALPAALAVAALAAAVFLRLRGRGVLTGRGSARGLLAALCHPLLAAGAAFGLAPLLGAAHPEFADYYDIADHGPALAGFVLLAIAIGLVLTRVTHRFADTRHQIAGAVALWVVLACVTAALIPAGSHVFTWPAAGLLLAAAVLASGVRSPVARVAAVAAAVVPLGLLVVPLVTLLTDALGIGLVAVPVVLVGLITPLLPAVLPTPRRRAVRVGGVGAVAAVAVGVLAAAVLAPSPREPGRRADVMYVLDAASRQAVWMSGSEPDAWSRRFIPDDVDPGDVADVWPGWRVPVRRGPASAVPLEGPEVTTTTVHDDGADGRRVAITAASRRDADELVFVVTGPAVRRFAVDGVPGGAVEVAPAGEPWELWVREVPSGGVTVVVDLAPGAGEVRVLDRTPGLPPQLAPAPSVPGPPALGIASVSDATLVVTRRPIS
ncbi:M28 family peptidase [Umezawaea beigongshangensis]|uniref:M28 family peptidase n=1 Tax=Umezawaea beigongshangensis TaxID=2780383 RepID=UPI0018F18A19|nr:M28 family peptidase [Umezawaea beigongshangensis]